MTQGVAALSFALVGCVAAVLGTIALRQRKKARFGHRRELSADEFYRMYYGNSGLPRERVLAVRLVVADELEVPIGRIRPSDRFDRELRPAEGWEAWDDGMEVLRAAASAGGGSRVAVEWKDIQTFDDLIRAVCRGS